VKKLAKAQAHLVVGFLGARLSDPLRWPLEVLSTVLSGQGGRLFVELRDKRSLAYSVTSFSVEGVDPGSFAASRTANRRTIDGDYDVFGDGSVQILKTPGHTPGHGVLEVKLRKSGAVILSGDLYHSRENRKFKRVPRINVERADTLASIDRIERIVKNTRARFIVQHDAESDLIAVILGVATGTRLALTTDDSLDSG